MVRGSGWQGHTCVKNIPQVGLEVWTKFGGDWFGGLLVKEGHWYKQSLLYKYRCRFSISERKAKACRKDLDKRCESL